MTLQEAMNKMDGNYGDVMERLPAESIVIRLLKKFLEDDSLDKLEPAVASGDYETIFAVTHNLKGVSANLGMSGLQAISSEICEATRNGAPDVDLVPMMENLKEKYTLAKDVITELTN